MDEAVRPIKVFGVVLMGLAIAGAFVFLFPPSFFDPASPSSIDRVAFYLLTGVHIAYFLTGLGVVLLKKWGYLLFKLFLYLLLLAFPIGTIISYVTLAYMRRHRIKRYFGFPAA